MNMTSYSSIFVELESTMTMSIPLAIILNEKAHYTKLSFSAGYHLKLHVAITSSY